MSLAARVSVKIEEGDFKGTIRLAGSDDKVALVSESTFRELQQKHPPIHPESSIPPFVEDPALIVSVTNEEVIKAMKSISSNEWSPKL